MIFYEDNMFFCSFKNYQPMRPKKRSSGPGRDAYASLAGGYRSKMEDGRDPAGSWLDCWRLLVVWLVALVKNSKIWSIFDPWFENPMYN